MKAFHRLRSATIRVWDFFFNPVFLRELRQAVRNRAIIYLILIYLLLLVGASIYQLVFASVAVFAEETGPQYFRHLFLIVFHTTLGAVVLNTSARLILERRNDDLMYYSTLRPFSIAWGKFMAGLMLSMLFYSATLPFATLAYMFRGLEVFGIFSLLFLSFALIQVFNLLVLACFAGVGSIPSLIFRTLLFLAGAALLYGIPMVIYGETMNRGMLRIHHYWEIIMILIVGFIFFIAVPAMLFFFALAQFAPKESNRMLGFRIATTLIFVPSLWICFFFSLNSRWYAVPLFIWYVLAAYPLSFLCFTALAEREEYGLRLRRQIPRSFLGRLFVFPLYSGALNAMVWSAAIIILSAFVALLLIPINPEFGRETEGLLGAFSCVLMCFSYAFWTLLLWSLFFHRFFSRNWIWTITFGLLIVGALCSTIFFTSSSSYLVLSRILRLNESFILIPNVLWGPSGRSHYHSEGFQFSIAVSMFLVSCAALAVYGSKQFRKFTHYAPPGEWELRLRAAENPTEQVSTTGIAEKTQGSQASTASRSK